MPQAYSPTAETPYQAYQPPEVAPAPPPIAATQQQPYQFTGAPTTHLGAAAGILDNIFRGYMRGREEYQAKQVMQMKAKSDNLRNSYNQDAALLYQMAQSGVDPNSQEYKQAMSAVQGSWGALQDWIGTHVNGEETKSGKKSKKAQQASGDPLLDLKSPDPQVRARALYALQQKMGPPVLWQVKQLQTPEAIANRQAQQLHATNQLTHEQAQATYDKLGGKTPDQLTDAEKTQLANSKAILFPPRQTGAAYLYQRQGPNGETEYQRFHPDEVPEDEGWSATPTSQGAKKLYTSPDGKQKEYYSPGMEPQGWQPDTKAAGGPKPGSFGFALTEKYGPNPTYDDYLKARRDEARARHVAGGGGPGAGADKTYQKWLGYYKEHYPGMSDEERDTLARRKTEGASQMTAGGVGFDASEQPQQFDSDVIAGAIDNLRKMPQYSGTSPLAQNFDQALANIVGLGDNGYQYHSREWFQQPEHQASGGKYAGDVTEDQLKALDRDLQTQIRIILSKQTGLPPDQKRAAAQRMAPLFGPAANYGPQPAVPKSGTPPASPPAAAPTPAPHSSAAPGGGLPAQARAHLKKGEITTFGNGQQWTLDEQGNPKQVK